MLIPLPGIISRVGARANGWGRTATAVVLRALLSLGLILGIAAMHTVIDTPMMAAPATSGHVMAHVAPDAGAALADSTSPELPGVALSMVDAVGGVVRSAMGSPSHEAMHACLLLVGGALLLMLALPLMRSNAFGWRPLSVFGVGRPMVGMRGAERIVALQVLRR